MFGYSVGAAENGETAKMVEQGERVPFESGAVANVLLDLAELEDAKVSPMKLQKLLYFAHGWYLAIKGEPLLDEKIEAWQYGPVVPSIYHNFKHLGNGSIGSERVTRVVSRRFSKRVDVEVLKLRDVGEDLTEIEFVHELLRKVWDSYKRFSALRLSEMTHRPGWAWDRVWNNMKVRRRNVDIEDEEIEKDFLNIEMSPQGT